MAKMDDGGGQQHRQLMIIDDFGLDVDEGARRPSLVQRLSDGDVPEQRTYDVQQAAIPQAEMFNKGHTMTPSGQYAAALEEHRQPQPSPELHQAM